MKLSAVLVVAAIAGALCGPALSEVRVGLTLSLTGPASSAGIVQERTVPLLPQTIGGEPVRYIVLDDATDPTLANRNARKLVTDSEVDVIVGSTATPGSLTIAGVATELKVPHIALAPFNAPPGGEAWSFKAPPSFSTVGKAVAADMKARDVKSIAFIGFADSLGQVWLDAIQAATAPNGVKLLTAERYNRTDLSILSQVLKVIGTKPDAVVVGATSSAAAEPQRLLVERGFNGLIYHTHAAATPEFLRLAGRSAEGAMMPASLPIVVEQLGADHPSRAAAARFVSAYEGKYGPATRSNFAAHLWDAALLLEAAIPAAAAKHKPGSPAFRAALRDALESVRSLNVTNGVVSMSPTDHEGFDARATVMTRVESGRFKIVDR